MSKSTTATANNNIEAIISELVTKAEEICQVTGNAVEDFIAQVNEVRKDTIDIATRKLNALCTMVGMMGVKIEAAGSSNCSSAVSQDSKSIWETTKHVAKTVNKYGSMPAYGVGYGAGYGVATLVNPILDLVEIVPLVGAVVTGARDGAHKATRHWEFVGQKARAMCSKKD